MTVARFPIRSVHIAAAILIVAAFTAIHAHAEGVSLAPPPVYKHRAFNDEFRNHLYFGYQHDTLFTNLHVGFDFAIAGLDRPGGAHYQLGVAALLHIYTIPRTENMKFYVDNFYAGFGLYLAAHQLPWLLWRFYPVYHVSAHLADGHPLSSVLWDELHAVSNEVTKAEVVFLPVKGLELGCALGGYYHSVGRDLKALIELNAQYAHRFNEHVEPYAQVLSELIIEQSARVGVQINAGVRFVATRGSATGLAFRFYSRPHPGYHNEWRQIGCGVEVFFVP